MSKLQATTSYPCCAGRAFVVLIAGTVKKKCPKCGQVWEVEVRKNGKFIDVWWSTQEEEKSG